MKDAEEIYEFDDGNEEEPAESEQEEEEEEEQIEQQNDSDMVELVDDSIQGFFEHKAPVYTVSINPADESMVASGGGDDKVYIWDSKTGALLHQISDFADSVSQIIFDDEGKFLAVASMEKTIRVYETASFKLTCRLECESEVNFISWYTGRKALFAGCQDNTTWLFKVPSGRMVNIFWGHSAPVNCGISTDSRIITGGEDGMVAVWHPNTAENLLSYASTDARFCQGPIVSVDHRQGQIGICGSEDKTAKLFHLQSKKILASFEDHTDSVEVVAFAHEDIPYAASAGMDGKLCIWDINTTKLRTVSHHDEGITSMKWHFESPLITTASIDRTVRTWDSRVGGDAIRIYRGHQDTILDFAMNKAATFFVSGSDDGCSLVFSK